MATGRVIRFDGVRGYGFIAPDAGGEDIFVHARDVLGGQSVSTGSQVSFESMPGERGLKAFDVRVIGADPPASQPASPAVRTLERHDGEGDGLGDMCDVLSVAEFTSAVTEVIIAAAPGVTAAQLVDIRTGLCAFARERRWVD